MSVTAPADPDVARRRASALAHLDLDGRGLEIGPLDRPLVLKGTYDVLYVDHADTDTINRKYADDTAVGPIHAIDLAWDGILAQVVPRDRPIRWVVASHVVEHVPDLASWFGELAEVIEPGGVLSLVVPDHRYCFDANRRASRPSELIGAAVERRTTPSAAQLVDDTALTVPVDTHAVWRGDSPHAGAAQRWRHGYEVALRAASTDEYVDCHCWTFTPLTFVDALEALTAAGLLDGWRLMAIADTEPDTLEFFAVLERFPVSMTDIDRDDVNAASFLARAPTGVGRGRPDSTGNPGAVELSPLERRLIGAKRTFAGIARRCPGVAPLAGARALHRHSR